MDILILTLIIVVAFQAGKHYGYYKIVKLMKEVAEDQGIDLEKELGIVKAQEEGKIKDAVRKLTIEQHGDLFYLFDKDTDEFVCQAPSVQELAQIAKKQKKIELAAVLFDKRVYKFIDGTAKEVTQV